MLPRERRTAGARRRAERGHRTATSDRNQPAAIPDPEPAHRPYTLFTSYRRENATPVGRLERELRLRGVRSWRDLKKIPHGSETVEQIRRAIREETDGFVAFVTPEYLARRTGRPDIVWELELPEAAVRASHDVYWLTPLFVDARPAQLTARCAQEDLPDLAGMNGRMLSLGGGGDEAAIAAEVAAYRAEARDQLANALRDRDGQIALAFRSFPMAAFPGRSVLDIDWTGEIDGASPERWTYELNPALRDLRDALGDYSITHLELHVLARLNAAIAFGMTIPLATGIEMIVHDRHGAVWGADGGEQLPLLETCDQLPGDAKIAVLDLSLVADLRRDACNVAERVGAGRLMRLETTATDRSPKLREVARSAAQQIGDSVRRLREQGVNDYHVLLTSPAPMAVLIGRQLHAIGRVHTYFSDQTRTITHAYTMTV